MSKDTLRKIPLEQFMDLKVDCTFKQLFGSEENEKFTIAFLNAMLQKTGRDLVQRIILINRKEEQPSHLNLVVEAQSNQLMTIEIQLSNERESAEGMLHHWSRLFIDQMQFGQMEYPLFPAIMIYIDNAPPSQMEDYHSTYHLHEVTTRQRIDPEYDMLEIHSIEMAKFLQDWHAGTVNLSEDILARWLLLLGMVDGRKNQVDDGMYQALEKLAMQDEYLMEAFRTWEKLSESPEARARYNSRLQAMLE